EARHGEHPGAHSQPLTPAGRRIGQGPRGGQHELPPRLASRGQRYGGGVAGLDLLCGHRREFGGHVLLPAATHRLVRAGDPPHGRRRLGHVENQGTKGGSHAGTPPVIPSRGLATVHISTVISTTPSRLI